MSTGVNPRLDDVAVARDCADYLERHRHAIVQVLTECESYETAVNEVCNSIDTLRNLHRELAHLRKADLDSVAVFLPINLPLYSLILFAAVPSLMAGRVDVRLPASTPGWLRQVAVAAHLEDFFPRVHLHEATRRQFIDVVASRAQAVIFTGRYESAEQVRNQCSSSVFLFEGSGVNPVVIGAQARLTPEVIDNVVTARVFNSGQDCAAPDVFLVHMSKLDEFVASVADRIGSLRAGSYDDPRVRIGSILNRRPLKDLAARLASLAADTIVGGTVDVKSGFVDPTVIVRPLSEHDFVTEFFAPIFYVLVYESDEELAAFFSGRDYRDNAMYVSLYGQAPVAGLFESSTVLFEQTVLQVEQGNTPFGGNGAKANYVACGNDVEVGPMLISEALSRVPYLQRHRVVPIGERSHHRAAHAVREHPLGPRSVIAP